MATMPETIIKVVTIEGAKLTLSAGDTLVLTLSHMPSKEQIESLTAYASKSLPEGVKVLVLGRDIAVAAEAKAADEPMVMPPDMAEQVRKMIEQAQVGLVDKLQRAGRI